MDIDNGMNIDIYDSMAAGVQNAAVVVCFMSKKYQDSANCALELKFAAQSGVPLVPVQMDGGFRASGWLGILTAGALWTPLHDAHSFKDNLEALIRQIYKSVVPEEDGEATFSIDDVKGELERMRDCDSEGSSFAATPNGGSATVPAVVPGFPVGLRVTAEMQQLLARAVEIEKQMENAVA